jgi:hypothetical protein
MRLSLGTIVPGILALALGSDAILRTLPLDPLAFRPWEAATRYRAPDAPFVASRSFTKAHAYGDLAALGAFPADREYRSETFTTDSWGYRNPPSANRLPPWGLLVGSSFSAGAGVNDDETLAARLGREVHETVYNAGGESLELWRIRSLYHRLGMTQGVVVYEYLERNDPPVIPDDDAPPPKGPVEAAFDRFGLETTYLYFQGWTAVSPLEVALGRRYRALKDDQWLPKEVSGVIERSLGNGERMLFLRYEQTLYQRRSRTEFIEYWRWLRRRLEADGLQLLVVLVPSKYTIYGDLLDPPDGRVQEGQAFLARLESGLRGRGIMAVNLGPPLRLAAAAVVGERRYVFFRDDTHWNAAGIELAAREVARGWEAQRNSLPSREEGGPDSAEGPE